MRTASLIRTTGFNSKMWENKIAVFLSFNKIIINSSFISTVLTGLTHPPFGTGLYIGSTVTLSVKNYIKADIAFIALYQGELQPKTIQGLMNWAAYEFGAAKNYNYGL